MQPRIIRCMGNLEVFLQSPSPTHLGNLCFQTQVWNWLKLKGKHAILVFMCWKDMRQSRQTMVNIKSLHMYHAEYNHATYSKNVTPILNNGICGVDIFKIMPLFKICDTYAAMLYSVPFWLVCREWWRVSSNA